MKRAEKCSTFNGQRSRAREAACGYLLNVARQTLDVQFSV